MNITQKYYRQFCNNILQHLEGNKRCTWFHRECGLCHNLIMFIGTEVSKEKNYSELARGLVAYQKDLFSKLGCIAHPFGDRLSYYKEKAEGRLYENESRLNHLRKYANEI